MRRLALLTVPIALIALALGGGLPSGASEPTPSPSESPTASPSPTEEPTPSPSPTPEPLPTTSPTPAPLAGYAGPLKAGDWVEITGTDSCLNARTQPGTALPYPEVDPNSTILNCLPDGFIGRLSADMVFQGTAPAPILADGHWWWHIFGQGWVAEDWLKFHHEGSPFWPPRPELASAGLIVYVGKDNGVWLMNADGSDQRLLTPGNGPNSRIDYLAWSPTGQQLSFTMESWGTPEAPISAPAFTRIVALDGSVVAELSSFTAGAWSPDGGRLSGIRVSQPAGLGGASGTPVVRDLISGAETPLGPSLWYGPAPTWSPDGESLAFFCNSTITPVQQPDGTYVEVPNAECGGDGLRIVSADGVTTRVILPTTRNSGVYYGAFSWSPSGNTIAVSSYPQPGDISCLGYVLVDVWTGATNSCFPFPPAGGFGGCGFSAETGASDWSPDGRYLLHHGQFGGGQNGVWIVDVASGEKTMIPVMPVSSIDVAPTGQQLAFAGAGNIWVADMDGANPAPIAEGASPVWQPTQ